MTERPFESILDEVLDEASGGLLLPVEFSKYLLDEQPVLFDYLFSSDLTLLTDEEGDFAFFLAAVILESQRRWKNISQTTSYDLLEEIEEEIWGRIEEAQRESHVGILPTALPEDLHEAISDFILDALEEDQEFLTVAGKQLIFVKLCTIALAIKD